MPEFKGVMSIINITPDSFYAESRLGSDDAIARAVANAVGHGTAMLDLGGYSSRPGADDISDEVEFQRLDQASRVIRNADSELYTSLSDMPVSVDTFRSTVVERLYDRWGEFTVNDISAGELDKAMIPLVARLGLPYIAMHSKGDPKTMNSLAQYTDLVAEVIASIDHKATICQQAGISRLMVDPGFGFAKTVAHNFQLLSHLSTFCDHFHQRDIPVLVGLSRKSLIWRTLATDAADDRVLHGTVALNWQALCAGADMLRVHDTQAAADLFTLHEAFCRDASCCAADRE